MLRRKAVGHQLVASVGTMLADAAAAEAVTALDAAGIRCLLLRGPAIAALLYDDPAERAYLDADLLVQPGSLEHAEAAIVACGCTESPLEVALPEARPGHAHTWRTHAGGMIDLHRTLIGISASQETAWAVLARDTNSVAIKGVTVETPSAAALALIVALHAAHHVDSPAHALDDLERALTRLSHSTWAEASRIAAELDALEAFRAGLALSGRGFAELKRLGLDSNAGTTRGKTGGGRVFHVAQGITWLASTPGARAKVSFLRRRLFPSPRAMRSRSSLARRGRVGLVLSYPARWLDAARHLPAALLALQRRAR
jgi:hypothetical protein